MFKDVTVDSHENPKLIKVRLKASKTDPFRAGVDVFVGATGNDLCPVAAVLTFLTRRGASLGPMFKFHDTVSVGDRGSKSTGDSRSGLQAVHGA